MENGYTVNIVSLEMDRDAETLSESRSESNSLESGVTVESSRGDEEDTRLDQCATWTNEKHNSYLDYLENSFVKQLYSLIGRGTQRLSTTRDLRANSHKSTDKFTVLQNGYWQKVNFGKKRVHLETSSQFGLQKKSSRTDLANPKGNYTTGTSVQENVICDDKINNFGDSGFSRRPMRNAAGHEYPTQNTAEASGQNFKDEEEEKERRNSKLSRKRKREAGRCDDNSSSLKDQVVPVGKQT